MIQVYAVEDGGLRAISGKRLPREDDLQRWIAEDPRVLGLELLVLDREVRAGDSGRIDVLGLDEQGNLVVIECKRNRTPREVIAQLLDYGSWAAGMSTKRIHELAVERCGRPLPQMFRERFEAELPEVLNTSHSLIVVATEFDPASRRIVEYLAQTHGVSINAIFFQMFEHQGKDLFAIEWLMDQDEVTERAESKVLAPWSGYYYVNVSEGRDRHWEDMRRWGFVCAGGGRKYSGALEKLTAGDLALAYQKQTGYVGLGRVLEAAVPVKDFKVDGRPVLELALSAPEFGHDRDDLALCEYVVRMEWIKTYSLSEAKTFPGVFANQHVVCRLRDGETLRQLKPFFPMEDEPGKGGK